MQVSCNKVGEMRYRPHATSNDRAPAPRLLRPPSTSHRPAKSDPTEHQSGASGTLRLSRPCKLLRFSRLAITMHNVRHMEWGFYSEKPATGAEGVRPGYTTATATHSTPQIFFRQLAPFALGSCTRRHATLHLACVIGRPSVPSFVL